MFKSQKLGRKKREIIQRTKKQVGAVRSKDIQKLIANKQLAVCIFEMREENSIQTATLFILKIIYKTWR